MQYSVELKKTALKDLKRISKPEIERILSKLELLEGSLTGDVKKLTNFTPEYRLRVGSYRILFEIEKQQIVVYRIKHRRDVYK